MRSTVLGVLVLLATSAAAAEGGNWWILEQGSEHDTALKVGTAWYLGSSCVIVQGDIVDKRTCSRLAPARWKVDGSTTLELIHDAGKDAFALVGPVPLRTRGMPRHFKNGPQTQQVSVRAATAEERNALDAKAKAAAEVAVACARARSCCDVARAQFNSCDPLIQIGAGNSSYNCEQVVGDMTFLLTQMHKEVPAGCR